MLYVGCFITVYSPVFGSHGEMVCYSNENVYTRNFCEATTHSHIQTHTHLIQMSRISIIGTKLYISVYVFRQFAKYYTAMRRLVLAVWCSRSIQADSNTRWQIFTHRRTTRDSMGIKNTNTQHRQTSHVQTYLLCSECCMQSKHTAFVHTKKEQYFYIKCGQVSSLSGWCQGTRADARQHKRHHHAYTPYSYI